MIDSDFLDLDRIGFFESCAYSEDKRYIVGWSSSRSKVVILHDEVVKHVIEDIKRPFYGAISNNGICVIVDYISQGSNESDIFIYNENGILQFVVHVLSLIDNTGISRNGAYIACQTCNSSVSDIDSGKLIVIDTNGKKVLSKFRVCLGWPDSYTFFCEENKIRCHFKEQYIEYSFAGICLEPQKIPVDEENPYDIFYDLEQKYSVITDKTSKKKLEDFLEGYGKLLKEDLSPYTLGTCYRRLGELSLLVDDKRKALEYLEKATEIYPKIGVKKKIAELKKF
jgi:tetratricopeptide (TPR) repeat protein